jgi:hypothetical protein
MNIDVYNFLDMFYSPKNIDNSKVKLYIEDLLTEGYTKEYLFTELVEQNNKEQVYKGKSRKVVDAMQLLSPKPHYIYKLYDRGKLVYIGQTISLLERLGCHKKTKKFDDVEIYMCSFCENVDFIENGLIGKYLPELNRGLNIGCAREWGGVEPVFDNINFPTCKFIDIYGYKEDSSTNYCKYLPSYVGGVRVRNDKKIIPYWSKNK